MTIRDFLDAILAFIGASSLTDDEYITIELEDQVYTSETYAALLTIIDARELVSNTRERLTAYFTARGVSVSQTSAGRSNIYAGSVLCD